MTEQRPPAEYVADERCLTLHVSFLNDHRREYPIHEGGDWAYREEPARIIVRPRGPKGWVRHEIPLTNVASVMIAPAQHDGSQDA